MTKTPWPDTSNPSGLPKIAICVPFNGNWTPEWAERVYIPLIHQVNWCQKVVVLSRVPSISTARDSLIKQALLQNCDYVLFLDSDVIVETPKDANAALSQLYQMVNKSKNKDDKNYKDARIVSALYRAKQISGFNYAMWLNYHDKGFTPIANWTGNWLSVDTVGLGFCLIDTVVFKEIPKPWFVWNEADKMSEDFYFCTLAKSHGFDVRVYTDTQFSHVGNLKVKCDGTVTVLEV